MIHSKNGFATVATRTLAPPFTVLILLAAAPAGGETITTINGADLDRAVFEVYVQNRAQRSVGDLAAQERETYLAELTDLYILSTQPGAAELKKDPTVAAQIELQKRAIVAQAFAARFLAENETTEEEIQAEYDMQTESAAPLQYKARHILVPTQGEAADLIAQLDTGSDFASLAMNNSTGPSAKDGGALPWFSPDQMVKPFSNAVASLEDGAYTSKPVQTEFGWHVILREDSRENVPPPLESIRETIKQNVAQKKFQAHLEMLRAEAADNN